MSSIPPDTTEIPVYEPEIPPDNSEEILAHESRNLLSLAVHHVVLRVAWIFKTESVIMPAFLDSISGAAWLRGCLPVLNRLGQSVPPLMLADRLRRTRHKKWPLLTTTLLMGAPFLILSVICFSLGDGRKTWLAIVFLTLYALFFSVTGLNQMAFGTIQGKLIRADRRGRLMGIAGTLGAIASITCAWFLLRNWLADVQSGSGNVGGFGYVFGFTGCGFVVAGLLAILVHEPADHGNRDTTDTGNVFRGAWDLFRHDREFRRIAIVAMLFMSMQLLFPHYQALGRGLLKANGAEVGFYLMSWVVAQNAGGGLFSLLTGAIADRSGNRLAVRVSAFLSVLTPLMAIGLSSAVFENGFRYYWCTFFLLGLTPVTMRTMVNYSLELAVEEHHPRYISTLKIYMAVPFVLSPFIGLLVDLIGFTPIFLAISSLVALAGLMTFRLSEPRHGRTTAS